MKQRTKTCLRLAGLLAGCALSVAFVASGRLEARGPVPGATLKLVSGRADELAVSPSGPLLVARDLRPGGERGGPARIVLWNPTDVTLSATPRVVPSTPDLDGTA